jgi:hypothetical protein
MVVNLEFILGRWGNDFFVCLFDFLFLKNLKTPRKKQHLWINLLFHRPAFFLPRKGV